MKHRHKFSRADVGLENNPGVFSHDNMILIVSVCACGKVKQAKTDIVSNTTWTRLGDVITSQVTPVVGFTNWKYIG